MYSTYIQQIYSASFWMEVGLRPARNQSNSTYHIKISILIKSWTNLLNPTLCLVRDLYIEQLAQLAPQIISPYRGKRQTLVSLIIIPAKRRAACTSTHTRCYPEQRFTSFYLTQRQLAAGGQKNLFRRCRRALSRYRERKCRALSSTVAGGVN